MAERLMSSRHVTSLLVLFYSLTLLAVGMWQGTRSVDAYDPDPMWDSMEYQLNRAGMAPPMANCVVTHMANIWDDPLRSFPPLAEADQVVLGLEMDKCWIITAEGTQAAPA